MSTKARVQTWIAVALTAAGGILFVASARMADSITANLRGDLIERYGPDGPALFHVPMLLAAVFFLVPASGLVEIVLMLVTGRGPRMRRAFLIYGLGLTILGLLFVGDLWRDWRLAVAH